MADSTIAAHQNHLRFFLKFLRYDQHPIVIHKLRIEQIETFLRQRARTNNRFSLQHVVASVRGFLQRHHAQGVLRQPLHHRIDTPRTYRLEQLPRALSWGQVVALLRSLDRSQLHPTVRRNRLRIVRNFLLFHARQHPRTFIPDLATFPPPSPHRPPRLVSPLEMARVLSAADQLPISHQNPLRPQTVRLALLLLFCCGLRRGELLRLRWRHCDLRENVLRVGATKFHKSRLVPLSPSVAHALDQYRELRCHRRWAVQADDYLIWSRNPLAAETVYSATALAQNWRFLCLTTGLLDERGRPPRLHDLRHSCAVARLERWYQAGTDLHVKLPHLATYLGHVSPVSTHHYLHLTPDPSRAPGYRPDDR